jgi:beta-galactosidase
VKVYSNASAVELKLNGVSLGTRNQDGTRIFLWPVTLRSGANAVSAVARSGATRVVDSVNWTVAGGFPDSVRIDVGSAVPYLDSQGNTWSADTFAQGGSVSSASGGVAGTADSALFQTYRIGNFSYHVPLANGTYTVRLLLMEPQRTSSGSRVMAVSAQGQTAQFGLDIFAAVGAHAALTETCTVAVTDNVLNLSFQPTKGQAIVSAISVTP